MIVAIDGPAGSGKSSTARAVARRLGFRHLDSGAFYRAITYAAMQNDIPLDNWNAIDAATLDSFRLTAEPEGTGFRLRLAGSDIGEQIRAADVTENVSSVARIPAVRDWLLDKLRDSARRTDLVADGRDIGTVVFPDADLKIFLVADAEARARRRLAQMRLPTDDAAVAAEVRRIEERDRVDSSRDVAPLRQANDAVRVDTTHLSFEQQVDRIVTLAREMQS
ncbi:MAG: (d)CMP kinase [Longimicrobiales bacterium]